MRIWQKIVLGFSLALLMLATVAVITNRSTSGLEESARWVAQRYGSLEQLSSLELHLAQVDGAARGYLLAADPQYLPAFKANRAELDSDMRTVREAVSSGQYEKPETRTLEEEYVNRLSQLLGKKEAILDAAVATRQQNGLEGATIILSDGEDENVTRSIRSLLGALRSTEEQRLQSWSNLAAQISHYSTAVVLMGTVLSAIILTLATLLILRDIAVRRRAEEALEEEHNLLRAVMDAMPEQVFVTDRNGCFIIDNISHRGFLGASLARDIEGKTHADFFPAAIAAEMARDDREVMETGKPVMHREDLVVRASGQVVWMATTKVPLHDVEGHCVGMVGVNSDISVRKEAEERLRLAAEQLRRSNLELQEFASVASHDLQEPLRKIQAFGDRLQKKCSEGLGGVGLQYLERMQDAARRMQILLHDLLTLSRVTSKGAPFEPVDLGKVVRDVVSDLEVSIDQTKAKVEIGSLPIIDADSGQMRQLLQNLISNALKFQPPGTRPEVIISGKVFGHHTESLTGSMPGDGFCQVMVQDNGIGFDERYLDRIFQVFQRLHSRSEYEGTGIGLAVCRKIAERHGGTISAKSAEGQGATFIVTLPVKQPIRDGHEEAR